MYQTDLILAVVATVGALILLNFLLKLAKKDLDLAAIVTCAAAPTELVMAVCAWKGHLFVTAIVLSALGVLTGYGMVKQVEKLQPEPESEVRSC